MCVSVPQRRVVPAEETGERGLPARAALVVERIAVGPQIGRLTFRLTHAVMMLAVAYVGIRLIPPHLPESDSDSPAW